MASGTGGERKGGGHGHKTIVLTSTETLSKDGENVGEDGGSCTITHVVSPEVITANCIDTLSLKRGQITVQGLLTFDESGGEQPFTVAVTGGTGADKGVGGEMDDDPQSDMVDLLTLHLQR
jgi:allene oxide cyclase-like protein